MCYKAVLKPTGVTSGRTSLRSANRCQRLHQHANQTRCLCTWVPQPLWHGDLKDTSQHSKLEGFLK